MTSTFEQAPTEIVLASGSPRRLELLRNLGLDFSVISSDIDESTELSDPAAVVKWLAQAKAEAVAKKLPIDQKRRLVIGADTIVALENHILGKPQSHEEALAMLRLLSGKSHKVFTGVAVVEMPGLKSRTIAQESTIIFRNLTEREMRAYAASDEPMDKAGAYALQGVASAFVERIEGCFTNVIGLPVPDTVRLLREYGVKILDGGNLQEEYSKRFMQ